jgi:diguanylate cyclase (GGDEF)-like protein
MSNRESQDKQPAFETNEPGSSGSPRPKKITFDDFQIQKNTQQRQLDDERDALLERERRMQEQKPGFLKFAVPRLRSIQEDMIGGGKKLTSMLFGGRPRAAAGPEEIGEPSYSDGLRDVHAKSYEANAFEEEQISVRVARPREDQSTDRLPRGDRAGVTSSSGKKPESRTTSVNQDEELPLEVRLGFEEHEFSDEDEFEEFEENVADDGDTDEEFLLTEEVDLEEFQEEESQKDQSEFLEDEAEDEPFADDEVLSEGQPLFNDIVTDTLIDSDLTHGIRDEPRIDEALGVYLDALRSFDSSPRRSFEPRDPRADFVVLLSEQLDILREQVGALSALFFWVNNKKQQLVLESGSLEDRAHMFLSQEKKFPIELDAVSMVVSRKKPELHSSIAPQAELDLIPYYREAIGVASFAAMPVLFGDGLVAVITVDSDREEQFSAETLRLLTGHSKLISGLIKSYIEKYDLLAAARTLESARKLYQLVSPDAQMRAMRDTRRGAEWILRALTEAIGEIVDWEWLATASFDDARRIWSVTSLQSKHGGSYVLPQTQIDLHESIVGKCIQSGRHGRYEFLTAQQVRFSLEEDRSAAVGHSFLTIPIRTPTRNYGALAIEHSDRARFSEADVETLEHLARSAASALEITALSEIVEERALTDLLTGVLNKRGFVQRLNEELSRAMEFDEPLTLVLFEIDAAAEFFSRFSQEDADTIILAVTRLLRYGARPFDVVARVGEHAFAAILIKMTDEEAYLWSEKMRKMVVSEVIAIGKRSFSVTASAGVSGARRDTTIEELIEGAELAVERAKELGGNNVIVY